MPVTLVGLVRVPSPWEWQSDKLGALTHERSLKAAPNLTMDRTIFEM